MTGKQQAAWFLAHPAALARAVGFGDMRDSLHGEWLHRMLYAQEDITLQAHRGSYKTTCLSVAIVLLMLKDRGKNLLFMRKTDGDVAEVIKSVRRILLHPVTQAIYAAFSSGGLEISRENQAEITLGCYNAPRGASQLLGVGIGGSLTGKHADIIITDDIVNLRDRVSRAERDRTKAIYQELQNIRNPGGRIINTGTPWHPEDAFSLMPAPEKYDCYTTGLLSEDQLSILRRSMAPSLFAANYELRHIASENALFTEPPQFTKDEALLADGIAHIDAAYGGEDYTAFTCARRRDNKLYLYGRIWQTHVDNVLQTILAETDRLRCGRIFCEDNGDKGFLAKEIKTRGGRAATYHEKENKYIKISTYLRKWWPNIVFLSGTDRAYINQIMDYTEDAEHDDAPDSAAVVCRWYDQKSGEAYVSPIFGG